MSDDNKGSIEDFLRALLESGESVQHVFFGKDVPDDERDAVEALLAGIAETPPRYGDWMYCEGMKVVSLRPVGGSVPAGTRGVVRSIERPKNDDEASADYHKGRSVEVEFDCSHLPFPPEYARYLQQQGVPVPETWGKVTTRVAPQAITPVVPAVTPENIAAAVKDVRDTPAMSAALRLAVGFNRVLLTIEGNRCPYAVDPAVGLALFRVGILVYAGQEDGLDRFRLTEFGWHVARALSE